ncbi:ABC transporter substrate-binding protein [Stigmatella aurantiaca]|uniref:ABC branched amino acid transporter family, periplasmic substrate-binding protein, putative n=1 Tax=Stigmatella aurantiaca (strain DW4/3-1) TaxID=378806 RepID=Q092F8_STIAD|nr:ABC transporter substrate-binding protein [Stigmatella aurantiaca]ADO69692.1 Receptor family ligand-binding protein [Stigmatella aurantiaca DW4/3-1]EAU66605.1 ABC branched amino acid transporter family, periplasmic substrate-binding protein, putative [Stigmatella aurantiaca DW4/3-1]
MRTTGIVPLLAALLAGCSLTTAGGLSECESSADCNSDQVCTNNFCLPQPAGCGIRYGELTASDTVQIGAVLPLSLSPTDPSLGKDASEEQGLNAIRLALNEINQRGAAGRRITLNLCDTASDIVRTRQQTEWLVNDKKIAALLTAGSNQTLAAAEVTLPRGVLTMSSTATSPELTSRESNTSPGLLWRTAPSDAIQGNVIADLLLNDSRFTSVKKVGILYLDDQYGQGLFNVITERLGTSKQTSSIAYARKTGNLASPMALLNSFDPDLTVVVGFEDDVSRIIESAQTSSNLKAGTGHQWFFTDSVKDAALLDDPTVLAAIQNSFGTAPAQGAGQAFKAFQSRFKSQYDGVDPSNYSFTSHSYDSMYLLGLAVAYAQGQAGQVTGLKMAEGLTHVSSPGTAVEMTSSTFGELSGKLASGIDINVVGASGNLQFDEAGEAPSPIELWQVQGSNFVTIKIIDAN